MGDQVAFAQLFRMYQPKIDGIAYAMLKSEQAAEELVQDIFLKIWQQRNNLSLIEDFNAYLFIITRNQTLNALRSSFRQRRREQEHSVPVHEPDNTSDDIIITKDYERFLQDAIKALPPQQQQVYRLSREKGLSREEIARLLKLSDNTVKTHLSKALKGIRAYLEVHIASLSLFALWNNIH